MAVSTFPYNLNLLPVDAVLKLIGKRVPREGARSAIRVSVVPLRTCYETLMRLEGPRDAVLDYAAALFADDAASPSRTSPPLALEEAHLEDDGDTLSLLLSRGMYATS
ncbi:MAG: hypothetical protein AB1762_15455 [Gemmatimonadota bacterium]